MGCLKTYIKCAVAALALGVGYSTAALGGDVDRLDGLFETLKQPDLANWQQVEAEIWAEWSKSGSPSADLMLEQGRRALVKKDLETAIEHFTALIDHAPDFSEGYNARATAYFEARLLGLSLADIQSTLALNSRHFGALTGLALIFDQMGDPVRSLSAYRMVNAIHPHRPEVKEAIERLEASLGETSL